MLKRRLFGHVNTTKRNIPDIPCVYVKTLAFGICFSKVSGQGREEDEEEEEEEEEEVHFPLLGH